MALHPLRSSQGFFTDWNHWRFEKFNILQPDRITDHPTKHPWELADLLDLEGITPQLYSVIMHVPRIPTLDAQFRAKLRQRWKRNLNFGLNLQVQRPNFHFEKQHWYRAQAIRRHRDPCFPKQMRLVDLPLCQLFIVRNHFWLNQVKGVVLKWQRTWNWVQRDESELRPKSYCWEPHRPWSTLGLRFRWR